MNRISVILLCITTLCIFWIINEKEDIDVKSYLDKIEMLEKKVDSLHTKNTLLDKQADSLEIQIVEFDKKIRNLNYSINVIKKETKAQLDAIDYFGDDMLEQFFADRYRERLNENDSIK